ncbi:glutamamyl carboxypeptidase putativemetallo-peptidase Clan MH Family M18 [Leptomonas pyrrhocoris]|uniref:Glutamamyl carboxypeptidase putativemetallo-peptidase Clan MH Family M18 n=1 Tax=Leptomonas pyrrhocoris TaxID=157538 RepID=A0A0M9FYU6_LEPPY|nr:glutamamyl carboxypeptidase putativemetallo-peptidase Clan MH Family M18 [Leptomonas pyrrhocoris]XP_015657210.1 glutamamyl carboxypeptidase putativemetallo-peptidase Clan MH Family M18 [Leptomonas pyrrhocoris]XP_015657211.1 glutamamyl carboxypeptidase putativemetallo-peptidase Clan MH Family M18 [Leptomonas pyrrhocoris]XP_015657212.1 glutamamyl carboxypeptidase putativemetallo-peptidase Clan MH Family M18 [Leptomonas pyrrhocoris]XP_015657213.1 glutamamyl carboxypeptidase putativemetallo-pept|eukprot:XP_015657209.1 glutamamyl carboxypeptidase putativemetallo-peptidase Clan MH Family M18 [Leptomonas pyrrhocoris]
MVEKDGKLFGRGACDMKGFLAVVLALVPQLLSMKRAKPVHIAFSFDEELGCCGVPYLIDYLKAKGFKADGCLIGEPTGMKVETGNKGFCEWHVEVHGEAIHSSMALMNTSCNANDCVAPTVASMRGVGFVLQKKTGMTYIQVSRTITQRHRTARLYLQRRQLWSREEMRCVSNPAKTAPFSACVL